MYRKLIFVLVLLCSFGPLMAQTDTSALYLRFPIIPPFKIIRIPDSTLFTKDDLVKKRPTLIMVFSPDCEHCQNMTKELKANIEKFRKAQIIMASPLEYSYLKKFYDEYGIADCPIITMGQDPGYMLGTFYKVRAFPKIYLYDKKGNYVRAFEGEVPISQIAESL